MSANYDVVIVGGGIVGTAMAGALGDSGLKVALLERALPVSLPATGFDARVSAITLASRAIFERIGAWDRMTGRRVAPVAQMRVWERAPEREIIFDAADVGEPALAYIIENGVLQTALLERVHQFTNVNIVAPAEIAGIALGLDAARVTLKDGRALAARLLIGANGAASTVRAAAAIETEVLALDQKAIVATVRTERPHGDTAWQRFLPSGPLAFLPLPEPNTASIVWSVDTPRARELSALADREFASALRTAFQDRLGAIAITGRRVAYPLMAAHARAYIAERVALIGDAVHTIHPLAGQGVNLGLLDAATLAEAVLAAAHKNRDIGARSVLRRYERGRKGDNLAMLAVTTGFKVLFGNSIPSLAAARDLGLRLTGSAPRLKQWIIRRAAGIDGDLPALARRRTNLVA